MAPLSIEPSTHTSSTRVKALFALLLLLLLLLMLSIEEDGGDDEEEKEEMEMSVGAEAQEPKTSR